MQTLIVVDRDGTETTVETRSGHSVMEAIRDAGFDDLLALCGGCCSCATCHVVVDPEWSAAVGAAGGDELDLLETSDHVTATSRLSCQITLIEALNGRRVRIAEED